MKNIKKWTAIFLILAALTVSGCSTLIGQGTHWPVPNLPDPPSLELGFQMVDRLWMAITVKDKQAIVQYVTELERELKKARATIETINR